MEKKSSQIIRENITYMINSDETTSMRNLSTSIGASDSFIQKILTEKANPSLDKIDLISEYFDVESWEEGQKQEVIDYIEKLNLELKGDKS